MEKKVKSESKGKKKIPGSEKDPYKNVKVSGRVVVNNHGGQRAEIRKLLRLNIESKECTSGGREHVLVTNIHEDLYRGNRTADSSREHTVGRIQFRGATEHSALLLQLSHCSRIIQMEESV